jgi:hypothetical protein
MQSSAMRYCLPIFNPHVIKKTQEVDHALVSISYPWYVIVELEF